MDSDNEIRQLILQNVSSDVLRQAVHEAERRVHVRRIALNHGPQLLRLLRLVPRGHSLRVQQGCDERPQSFRRRVVHAHFPILDRSHTHRGALSELALSQPGSPT